MNKYVGLFLFAIFLLGSGFIYQVFYRPKEVAGVAASGRVVEISMRVLQNQWKWNPDTIHVQPGDRVKLHIFNEDTYDHGFAIDVFGVNRRLFPGIITELEFIAGLKGTFNFYCSVPCGEGHYDQIGRIIVGEEHENDIHSQNQIDLPIVFTGKAACPNSQLPMMSGQLIPKI